MKSHDKTLRKHICSYCPQRFITKRNRIDHEQRHLGDKPHICLYCSKGFHNPEDLQTHTKLHAQKDDDDDAAANQVSIVNGAVRDEESLSETVA